MKPNREAADAIIAAVRESREIAKISGTDTAFTLLRIAMMNLASALIPYDEAYGHAKRLHELTEKPTGRQCRVCGLGFGLPDGTIPMHNNDGDLCDGVGEWRTKEGPANDTPKPE